MFRKVGVESVEVSLTDDGTGLVDPDQRCRCG